MVVGTTIFRAVLSSGWKPTSFRYSLSYSTRPMTHHDYHAVLDLLDQQRRKGPPSNENFTPSRDGMLDWLNQLGHSNNDIDSLRIIHVAGTKGKGSTCAYIECLLRARGLKTGLYTGPPLNGPEERIRINFEPLSKQVFADYVSEIYQTLHDLPKAPRYLQLLTLVSFRAFIQAGVDVAIYETHHGGEYDATNFVSKPTVTAITVIDYDHTETLGDTLERIAWHKGGILKSAVFAFSAIQQPTAASMLQERASEKGAVLKFVEPLSRLPANIVRPEPEVQLENFSLAYTVCNNFLQQLGKAELSSDDLIRASRVFSWPGRFQTIADNGVTWFLDGAHNDLSLRKCAHWFAGSSRSTRRLLIFGQPSANRDPTSLVNALAHPFLEHGTELQHVIFTVWPARQSESNDTLRLNQQYYTEAWETLNTESQIHTTSDIEEAIDLARSFKQQGDHVSVLITGSLYLVGRALRILSH